MSILKEHISHMEKDQLNFHQSELTAFFLTALDFRAEHCQVGLMFLRVDLKIFWLCFVFLTKLTLNKID